MYEMYLDGVRFPVTPAKLSIKSNNQNRTINLIHEGEINIMKAPGLLDISIDKLLLPVLSNYPFARYEGGVFKRAEYFLDLLERWKASGKPVPFVLSRLKPDGSTLLFETNRLVTVENYEIREDAKELGFDVEIRLDLKEYRIWGSKRLEIREDGVSCKITENKKNTRAAVKEYVIKKGDCLYNIAKKQLNQGSRWKEIYDLNKKAIEEAARKHGRKSSSQGRWIWEGTKLKLPK